jgi:hypothetical protein
MIALLTVLCIGTADAADDPKVSVSMDSGLRPFGLPIGGLLGGGVRIGAILGTVTPFAGGSATWGQGRDRGDFGTTARLLTAQTGVRIRVGQLEAAETYVLGAALLTNHSGSSIFFDEPDNQVDRAGVRGIGGFGGGGVDAHLSNRVSIGIEAGLAYTGAVAYTAQKQGNETFEDETDGSVMFTYSNLHLTLWLGGES